jgi:hypothetical protein
MESIIGLLLFVAIGGFILYQKNKTVRGKIDDLLSRVKKDKDA